MAWIHYQDLDNQLVVDIVSLLSLVVHYHRVAVMIELLDNLEVVVADHMDSLLEEAAVGTVQDIHLLVVHKGFDSQKLIQSKSPMSLLISSSTWPYCFVCCVLFCLYRKKSFDLLTLVAKKGSVTDQGCDLLSFTRA